MRIFVLGGSGAMGREIVREILAAHPKARVTAGDVRCDFYELDPPAWVGKCRGRLTWKKVDLVREPVRLAGLLRGHLCLINATTHHLNLPAMKVCLRAGAHYMDLGGLFHHTRRQLKLHRAFEKKGLLAILGMGCAPGLSNLLAVRAAEDMDGVESIDIKVGGRSLSRSRAEPGTVVAPYAVGTIREELTLKPAVFEGGQFRMVAPRTGREQYRFPAPVGLQTVFFTLHSEVATLPLSFRGRGVRRVSFKIGFDESLIHALVRPRRGVRFVQPKRVRDVEITSVRVQGRRAGKPCVTTLHAVVRSRAGVSAGTIDTILAPAAATGLLGRIVARGVLPPERAVPADAFLQALQKRGVRLLRNRVRRRH